MQVKFGKENKKTTFKAPMRVQMAADDLKFTLHLAGGDSIDYSAPNSATRDAFVLLFRALKAVNLGEKIRPWW